MTVKREMCDWAQQKLPAKKREKLAVFMASKRESENKLNQKNDRSTIKILTWENEFFFRFVFIFLLFFFVLVVITRKIVICLFISQTRTNDDDDPGSHPAARKFSTLSFSIILVDCKEAIKNASHFFFLNLLPMYNDAIKNDFMIVFLSVIFYTTFGSQELDYIITFMSISLAYIIAVAVEINYNTMSWSSDHGVFAFNFSVVKN